MNILFIPYCKEKNTFARISLLIKTLESKHTVFLVQTNNSPIAKLKTLQEAEKILKEKNIDLIFCSLAENAFFGSILAKRFNKPLIFDSHGSIKLFADSLKKNLFYRWLFGFFEKESAKAADAIITVSETDKKQLLKQGVKKEKIFVLPTWIDFAKIKKQKTKKRAFEKSNCDLLFFASLNYKPNQQALEFITKKLAPALKGKAIIHVCGSGEPKIALPENVKFHGFVPDLVSAIEKSDAVIAPIWQGVGILEKVLLAMACEKVVITTSFAHNGIPELKDKENAIIAENEKEFVKKTLAFVEKKFGSKRIEKKAKELIKEKYSSEQGKKLLKIINNTVFGSAGKV